MTSLKGVGEDPFEYMTSLR